MGVPWSWVAAEGIPHDVPKRERPLLVDRKGCVLWGDHQQAIGMLGLYPGLTVGREQSRQIRIGHAFEQSRLPPESCRGHGEGAYGVSDVMVAVAEGPLAVFPRLSPVD